MLDRARSIAKDIVWDGPVKHGIVPVWRHSGRKTRVLEVASVGAGVLELTTSEVSGAVFGIRDKFDGGDNPKVKTPALETVTPTLAITTTAADVDRNITGDGRVAVRSFIDKNANGARDPDEQSVIWNVNLTTPKTTVSGIGTQGTNLRDLRTATDGKYAACPVVVDGWVFTTTTNGCQVGELKLGDKLVFDIGVVKKEDLPKVGATPTPVAANADVRAEVTPVIPGAGNGLASLANGPDMGIITLVGLGAFAVAAIGARMADRRSRRQSR